MVASESFNKEYIIKCCEGLYAEAFDTNSCIKILLQIGEYRRSGDHGMDPSPCFYNTTCNAMIRAAMMDVAKIYDGDSKSISLLNVISYCNQFADCFPNTLSRKYVSAEGRNEVTQVPIRYTIREGELKRIKEDSRLHREIELTKVFQRFFDLPCEPPFDLEVTAEELFAFYGKRHSALNDIIKKVKNQRDKRYAHNDKDVAFDYERLLQENNITFAELEKLVDFALEVTTMIIELLTGEHKPWSYYNIDDLADTLNLVKLGIKQKENGTS